MSRPVEILLLNLALLSAATSCLWALSLRLRDASIADIFWGFGFVLVAWTSWIVSGGTSSRLHLLVAMVTIWGTRLASYLLRRRWGEKEDTRYAVLREGNAPHFWWSSLLSVFFLQGALIWFVSLPVQMVAWLDEKTPLHWLDGLGVLLWLVGLFFEAVGDSQLARFKSKPLNKGRVLDKGLWRYTRHPNYFGDFCVWWGIYLVAVAGAAAATVASPVLMAVLLLKVSGVGLLERTIVDRRPDYAEYQRHVNAFFPGPRRRR